VNSTTTKILEGPHGLSFMLFARKIHMPYNGRGNLQERLIMSFKDKLKKAWDENPLQVIAIGAAAITAVAVVVDTTSKARARNTLTKQRQYRMMTGQ
jgi:hypothetical protein